MPTHTKVPTVLVRDMVGMSAEDGRQWAAETDLPVEVTTRQVTDPDQDGVVIAQSPVAGARGRAGDVIRLVVGVYTPPVEPASPVTSAAAGGADDSPSASSAPSAS